MTATVRLTVSLFTLLILGFLNPAITNAQVNFVFNFTDPAGAGFNAADPVGADRRAGLNMAADVIESLFVNYSGPINIDVNGSQTDDETLASAASSFNADGVAGFGNRGDVGRIILGMDDRAPGVADGTVDWNFEDFSWEPFGDFQAGEMDLISTATHELLHAVGFSSDIGQNGEDAYGNVAGTPGNWTPFDQYVSTATGSIIDSTTFALDGSRWDAASTGGAGSVPAADGLYFNGPNAMAANGGNPVPLYSPTSWEDGSSGSHLDTDFFVQPNSLMMNHESPFAEGLDIRNIDPITIGILKDIGFTQVVPEPSTGVMFLGVLMLICVIRPRR